MRSLRSTAAAIFYVLISSAEPSWACSLGPFKREPTISEMVAGLPELYAGTVVGYVREDGTRLTGPIPKRCQGKEGGFEWWSGTLPSSCNIYLDVKAALFRVDVEIVGPAKDEIVPSFMSWGDGDCNHDYQIGERWLLAGFWYTQKLNAPLRDDEVRLLRRLAAHPPFDFKRLLPGPGGTSP
jgi:hypothetical protein